jgi:hypothetical protein
MIFDLFSIASTIAGTAFEAGKEITKGAGEVCKEVAINAGKGIALGVGIGATVGVANLVMSNLEPDSDGDDFYYDEEIDRLTRLLEAREYRRRKKRR